eukprot:1075575-Rhodomonas_salina.1
MAQSLPPGFFDKPSAGTASSASISGRVHAVEGFFDQVSAACRGALDGYVAFDPIFFRAIPHGLRLTCSVVFAAHCFLCRREAWERGGGGGGWPARRSRGGGGGRGRGGGGGRWGVCGYFCTRSSFCIVAFVISLENGSSFRANLTRKVAA